MMDASSRTIHVMRGCVRCWVRAGVRVRLKAVRGSNDVESLRSSHTVISSAGPQVVQSDQQSQYTILYRETAAVCPEVYTKHTNKMCGAEGIIFYIKRGDALKSHWALTL
jgi:hypothetical protein